MPCLLGCLALLFPRISLALVWLFGDGYLTRAFGSFIWVLLGFIFLPLTTLVFAYTYNSLGTPGEMTPLGWLMVVIALLVDFGLVRGGHSQYSRYRRTG